MSTVLVTGASGFVGSHLTPALIDAGHHVLALVRDDEAAAVVERRLGPGQRRSMETRRGDVTKPGSLAVAGPGTRGWKSGCTPSRGSITGSTTRSTSSRIAGAER